MANQFLRVYHPILCTRCWYHPSKVLEALFSIFWAKPYLGTLLGVSRVQKRHWYGFTVYYFWPKNSAHYYLGGKTQNQKKKGKKWERDLFFWAHRIYVYFLSLVGVSLLLLLLLLMGVKNGKTIPCTQLFALVVGTTQVRYRLFFRYFGRNPTWVL